MQLIDQLRATLDDVQNARWVRDGLRDRACVIRSGLSADTVRTLRAAGLTREEIESEPSAVTPAHEQELAEIVRQITGCGSHLLSLECRLRQIGKLLAAENARAEEMALEASVATRASARPAKVLRFPAPSRSRPQTVGETLAV